MSSSHLPAVASSDSYIFVMAYHLKPQFISYLFWKWNIIQLPHSVLIGAQPTAQTTDCQNQK